MGALSNVITRIKALITADNKDFKKKMQDTASETEKTSKKVNKSAKGIGTAIKAIMGAAVVGLAVKLTGAMIKVRAEFEKYESMLKVALGSQDAAARSMKQLTEFASKTPFQLNELTDSFVKLVNQGINPTEQQMTNMGDLAAAMGKDFVQLTEAIIDAQTGEFERLKEFGIRATKEGDKVKFTFKGVETQVDFTAKAISNYIFGLGQLQGVSGSMAEVSKTLGGRISNLKDNWTTLMNTMGTQSSGVIMSVVNFMINLANLINENILRMRRFKEEYLDENVRDSLDGMIKGVELWVSENQKAGDNVTEARRKAIDMQLLMEQKYIDDQKRLLNDAIKSGNDKQKEKLEYIIKTQNLAIQALKDHYTEVEKVEAQALLDMNAEQLAAQQQRLKDQKSFFWSWQGLIMDGMGAIQGATLDAFNSQVPAIDAANKGLENYQANLGMLMQAIPLVIPMIQAQTQAQIDQAEADQRSLESSDKMHDALEILAVAINEGSNAMVQASAQSGISFREMAQAAVDSAKRVISAAIAEGIAKQVSSALATVPFPFGLIAGSLAGGAAAALFNQLIPSFSEGGMVTQPTLALVGDNPSGKEMIIPWEKLGEMGGGPVEIYGELRGDTMYLQRKRTEDKLRRTGRL